jgi:hypothetical protein
MWGWQIREGAEVIRGPYAASAWAPIDPRDLAEVGACALLGEGLETLAGCSARGSKPWPAGGWL